MARLTAVQATYALLSAHELKAHEQVEAAAVSELARAIREQGVVERPVVVDEKTRVILDGHHRFAALTQLACVRIPCYLVDYSDPSITVDRWDGGGPLEKRTILDAAAHDRLLAPKTSRHPTLRDLPERPTPLDELVEARAKGGGR